MNAETSDEGLAAQLAGGDTEALRLLYRRHAALVFSVARRVLDESSAEDVVQDVFVTVWKKSASFDPEKGAFSAWVAQIARRSALNELRRNKARATSNDDVELMPDEAMAPDEAQWSAHRQSALRRALDALPANERQALTLAFLDEMSHREVAEALNAPLGTTKTRIRLGLRRLAPILTALVGALAIFIGWKLMDGRRERSERALAMVTSSDVTPLRLSAQSGVAAEAHGNYRARRGVTTAVLTTSSLPALPKGEHYAAWVRHGADWTPLGDVVPGADGRSLSVAEAGELSQAPDEVVVTRESTSGSAPQGPVVLAYRARAQ